jgi:cation diffusion facilitator family transporter
VKDVAFGRTELPRKQAETLRRAIRLEWITIGFLVVAVTLVGLVLGNSQAMKAAWAEDLLSLLPPIAFLVAVRIIRKPPSHERPYGYHRSVGVAHLVAAVALVVMGTLLIIDSGMSLITAEHPAIGSVELFGQVFWLGWLMIGAMVLTGVPPVLLGRAKMKLAEDLHDKVLYADADMNKADWMTALGSIIGVSGIGIGLWWTDAVAALFISFMIMSDGVKNVRSATRDLMDVRAKTYDGARPHPVIGEVEDYLRGLDWVAEAGARARDEGHVFHVECFVVPRDGCEPSVKTVEQARTACANIDWRMLDVVVVPVPALPAEVAPPGRGHGDAPS